MTEAKRYILLNGDDYATGGWHNFRGDFDTIEEAFEAAEKGNTVWHDIVDLHTFEEVDDRVLWLDYYRKKLAFAKREMAKGYSNYRNTLFEIKNKIEALEKDSA